MICISFEDTPPLTSAKFEQSYRYISAGFKQILTVYFTFQRARLFTCQAGFYYFTNIVFLQVKSLRNKTVHSVGSILPAGHFNPRAWQDYQEGSIDVYYSALWFI